MDDARSMIEDLFRDRREAFLRVLARRLGKWEDAEETLQDAFIQFGRAGNGADIANPDAYLMQIALNLAVDRIRQNASRTRREENWFEAQALDRRGLDYVAPTPSPDRALIAKDELARLGRHLEELSPMVRSAFILHKIRGLSHIETAEQLKISKSTVEKHIMKAMKFLMDKMAE